MESVAAICEPEWFMREEPGKRGKSEEEGKGCLWEIRETKEIGRGGGKEVKKGFKHCLHCPPKPSNWDNFCVDLSTHLTKWIFHCSHLLPEQLQLFCLWPALAWSCVESTLLEYPVARLPHHRAGLSSSWTSFWGAAGVQGLTLLPSPGWSVLFCDNGIWGAHFIAITLPISAVLYRWQITLTTVTSFGLSWPSAQARLTLTLGIWGWVRTPAPVLIPLTTFAGQEVGGSL